MVKPDIFNSDQGSQFTSDEFTGMLEQNGVSRFYNNERPHQALGYLTLAAVYNSTRLDNAPLSLILSKGVPGTAESHPNLAPFPILTMGST